VSEPADEDDYIEKAKLENVNDQEATREGLCPAGRGQPVPRDASERTVVRARGS